MAATAVAPGTTEFQRALVTSVALSCLLTMDYVPGSKPPKIEEMVQHELPRILNIVPGITVPPFTTDPAALLASCMSAITDFARAANLVISHGHEDMVFSALQYMRKPPTATAKRIRTMTQRVAKILKIPIPAGFEDFVGDAYEESHRSLVRV
jgi:hypothetical protein